jgi:hypothetical protein
MAEWAARCEWGECGKAGGKVVVTKGHAYGIRLEAFKRHAERDHRDLDAQSRSKLADLLLRRAVQNGLDHRPE